jgi:hypothetical protein
VWKGRGHDILYVGTVYGYWVEFNLVMDGTCGFLGLGRRKIRGFLLTGNGEVEVGSATGIQGLVEGGEVWI